MWVSNIRPHCCSGNIKVDTTFAAAALCVILWHADQSLEVSQERVVEDISLSCTTAVTPCAAACNANTPSGNDHQAVDAKRNGCKKHKEENDDEGNDIVFLHGGGSAEAARVAVPIQRFVSWR